MARRHNDANVLALAGRTLSDGRGPMRSSRRSSSAEFEGGRHQRRVDQISDIESGQAAADRPWRRQLDAS